MIDAVDRQLIAVLQQGLPLVSRPYAVIGAEFNLSETEVLARVAQLKEKGIIKRLGVIVNHRRLGYKSNAMVVFDVDDGLIAKVGEQVSQFNFVNLCYQRPRYGELWPYNLYCMIHGKNRDKVLQQLAHLIDCCGLQTSQYEVLFSKQCFKQRGALYRMLNQQEKLVAHG